MLKLDDEFATSAIVALSSFNYYYDSPCRVYLTQAMKSSCTVMNEYFTVNLFFFDERDYFQALRLYSTSLLRVVLRANPVAFGSWGLSLLTSQLYDSNQAVLLEATSILDEALEDRVRFFIFLNETIHVYFSLIRDW